MHFEDLKKNHSLQCQCPDANIIGELLQQEAEIEKLERVLSLDM